MKNEEIKKYQDFLKLKGFQLKKSKGKLLSGRWDFLGISCYW